MSGVVCSQYLRKLEAGKLASGIDVRGDGGYVLVPPSKADNKKTSKKYSSRGIHWRAAANHALRRTFNLSEAPA